MATCLGTKEARMKNIIEGKSSQAKNCAYIRCPEFLSQYGI